MPKKKESKKIKLLSKKNETAEQSVDHGEEESEEDKKAPRPIISYWWPNVTINIVASHDPLPTATPPIIMNRVRLTPDGTRYYPIFYVNDFWMLQENLMPVNETTKYDVWHQPLTPPELPICPFLFLPFNSGNINSCLNSRNPSRSSMT